MCIYCLKGHPAAQQTIILGDLERYELTMNVFVVYMARDVMILMRENTIRGPLEGVGPENQDFFGS